MVELWTKPEEHVVVELEIAEGDGDVWFYSWHHDSLVVDDWNKLEATIPDFILRQRSIGDGRLNLRGIYYFRLTLCDIHAHGQTRAILFDNVGLKS